MGIKQTHIQYKEDGESGVVGECLTAVRSNLIAAKRGNINSKEGSSAEDKR